MTTETPTTAAEKLAALRTKMQAEQLDAYWIPSGDEHLNEYLPPARKRREWLSGFTGSTGDCLVAADEAWVFVDSRYHEQAAAEVDTHHLRISKLGLEGEPTLHAVLRRWITQTPALRIGVDPWCLGREQQQQLEKLLAQTQARAVYPASNLVDALRPPAHTTPALQPVYALDLTISGQSAAEKIQRVQAVLAETGADFLPLTKLDQIAWLFNLRGQDIPYNPVFIAYALITHDDAFLFTEIDRIETGAMMALNGLVTVKRYDRYRSQIEALVGDRQAEGKPQPVALIDGRHTTAGTCQWFEQLGVRLIEHRHPVEQHKAIKNPTELGWIRRANLQASRAKIRTLAWLDNAMAQGESVSEERVAEVIEAFYAEEPEFKGLSFNTIAGAGPNSAIVHYGTPSSQALLSPGAWFLLDSGAQYLGGTTDDTRTTVIGQPTPDQQARYTQVLRAHIHCARQHFPKGTEGRRLDGIARAPLWQAGLDYGHGTGHGVGAFLNVHEGPNGIHKLASEPLVPGMITSIEPGFYQPGWGGIRLENLYEVIALDPQPTEAATPFYGFRPLTLIPFARHLIDRQRLDAAELGWLQTYYAEIATQLMATLDSPTQAWLRDQLTL